MASYTMPLSNYIEAFSQDVDEMSWDDRIEAGRTKLFDFSYPIFDNNYKKVFETHFINNFYMSEIGFETEGLFKFRLKNWLNINMPYFNNLFKSELIQFDPLKNTDLTETANKKNDKTQDQSSTTDGTSSGTSHQTGSGTASEDDFNRQLTSDTPESRLTITSNDGQGVIEYASSIEENNTNNSKTTSTTSDGNASQTEHVTSDTNATINETEDYLNSKIGKIGTQSYSKMIQEYRETFLRIEKQIFDEMRKELFMIIF